MSTLRLEVLKITPKMSLMFDKQLKILSDIPVYSETKESSPPHVEMFENQAYSTNTLVNTHATVEKENSYDDVLGTKTAPHKENKEKSKKDQYDVGGGTR